MRKVRLLVWGDAVNATGFSRVLHSIIRYLPQDVYDIYWVGVNYYGDPHDYPYKIYPASSKGDLLGINRLEEIFAEAKPDIIFGLGDIWGVDSFLEKVESMYADGNIPATFIYFPVDAREHDPEWYKRIHKVFPVTYTEFGLNVATKARPDVTFSVIPHGVDTESFFMMDIEEARKIVFKENADKFKDSFIVLNANRNQPRKRLDLTIKGFALFAENKPENVKLYMHSGVIDSAINTSQLARRLGLADRFITTSRIPGAQQSTIGKLNAIYNSANVGINTSLGEGWGLCVEENTPVWTKDGIKKIKDVTLSDEVLTDKGRYRKVVRHLYNGVKSLLSISTFNSRVLRCTPEHLVMTQDGWKKAGELTLKDSLEFSKPQVSPEELVIDLAESKDFFCDDDFVWEKNSKTRPIRKFKRYLNVNNDLAEVVGYYLSRGKVVNGKKITIPFRSDKKAFEVMEKVRGLGIKTEIGFDRKWNKPLVVITEPFFVKMFNSMFGKSMRFKKVPSNWFDYNLYKVVENYMEARLKKAQGRTYFYTFTDILSSFITQQIHATGRVASVKVRENFRGRFCEFNLSRMSRENLDTYFCPIMLINDIGTGRVYDLEVEEDHSYVANGLIVHNCSVEHACTGKLQIVPKHSACEELFDQCGLLIPITMDFTQDSIMTEGAIVRPEDVAEQLEIAYTNSKLANHLARVGYRKFTQSRYSWKSISGIWHNLFQEALDGNNLA